MKSSIIVYKDGSHKKVDYTQKWEYENDPDWLTTIDIRQPTEQEVEKDVSERTKEYILLFGQTASASAAYASGRKSGANWMMQQTSIATEALKEKVNANEPKI